MKFSVRDSSGMFLSWRSYSSMDTDISLLVGQGNGRKVLILNTKQTHAYRKLWQHSGTAAAIWRMEASDACFRRARMNKVYNKMS